MSKPRLYFAHPVNVYNTDLERFLMHRINERFPDHEIVNPGEPVHEVGYKAKGMAYFLEDIVPSCEGCVLLAFRDGKIGKGVYAEALALLDAGHPVWEIDPNGTINDWMPSDRSCLTVDETRARIRNADRSPKPY